MLSGLKKLNLARLGRRRGGHLTELDYMRRHDILMTMQQRNSAVTILDGAAVGCTGSIHHTEDRMRLPKQAPQLIGSPVTREARVRRCARLIVVAVSPASGRVFWAIA